MLLVSQSDQNCRPLCCDIPIDKQVRFNDGLTVGDVLTVFQDGPVVVDHVEGGKVKLPDESAGTIMVFKTYDDISYGLVMEATTAIHNHDYIRNPI